MWSQSGGPYTAEDGNPLALAYVDIWPKSFSSLVPPLASLCKHIANTHTHDKIHSACGLL